MLNHLKIIFTAFIGVLYLNNASAQFTYGGLRLSYHNVKFDNKSSIGSEADIARINNMVVNLDLIHRPIRNLAVGASFRIPVIKGFRYEYSFDQQGEYVSGGGLDAIDEPNLAEGRFEYDVELSSSMTFFMRIYFDVETNYFLDLRYSIENYNETLNYQRQGTSLPDMSYSYAYKAIASGPGFAIGYMPKIGDHFYFKYMGAADFLSVSGSERTIANISANNYSSGSGNLVNIPVPSQMKDKALVLEFSMGFGYSF